MLLWQETHKLSPTEVLANYNGTAVPVDFHIPQEYEPTSPEDFHDRIIWQLEVSASLTGVDYLARFDVPVFNTKQSQSIARQYDAIQKKRETIDPSSLEIQNPSKRQSITSQTLPSGELQIDIPAFRNPAIAGVLFGTSLFFAALLTSLWYAGGSLFLYLCFGAMFTLCLYGALDYTFGKSRIRVIQGRLSWRHRILGIGRTKTYQLEEVEKIEVEIYGGSTSKPLYAIRLHRLGKRLAPVIASAIADKRLAEEIAHQIRDRFYPPID